ncbi:YndJ family transporter [Alkalihalobacillus deserti]|uniref:YndJ family transporter n=1 Tax=Alkalihalobacillus deserti TaxID=2879466 RepID=UPI001D13A807|nr:YndJ family transporter [Alkalihalobacillus deserti]
MKHPFFPAIIGAVISFVIFTFDYFQFSLIEKFLMFASFVIMPLIILLINNKDQTKFQKKIYSFITVLHFPAALLSLASLMSNKTWETGNSAISGSLSLAWLLFTFLLALYGLLLILEKKEKIEEIAIGAELIYFFIGGIWYTLYQFQLTFLLVDPTVSALSSVHFHFSSAIVPIFIANSAWHCSLQSRSVIVWSNSKTRGLLQNKHEVAWLFSKLSLPLQEIYIYRKKLTGVEAIGQTK